MPAFLSALGVTVVYVTHDQQEAMTLSDRVAVFHNGMIEQAAPPEVLYEEPERAFVARFIGENNRLDGVVVSEGDGVCEVAMSTAYNGRIFNAQVLENQPFVIVRDGQILDRGQLVAVADTPRLEDSLRFLRYSARAEAMAGVGRYIAYSPARRSGQALIDRHAETGTEMWPHMPTNP